MEKPWTHIFCSEAWISSSKGAGGYLKVLLVLYMGLSYTGKNDKSMSMTCVYVFYRIALNFISLSYDGKVGQ